MSIVRVSFVLLVALLLTWSVPSVGQANVPLGGIAVAVSPDGARLVAGGDNRTLYVLDAKSLEVQKRIALDATIWDLAWSADGARVLVEDTDATLRAYDTTTWEVVWSHKKHGYMAVAAAAGQVAVRAGSHRQPEIRILSIADGSTVHAVKLGERAKVAMHGIRPDGKRLAILFSGKKDEAEPRKTAKDMPQELKGDDRKIWSQKHDGNTARFVLFEPGKTEPLVDTTTWYTSSSGRVVFAGDAVWFVNYSNLNARFDAKGQVEAKRLRRGFNYGMGMSADHKVLALGGLKTGALVDPATGKATEFRIPDAPGWPEYFKRFAVAPDGSVYASTTAWKIHRIAPDGKVAASVGVR